MTHYTKCPFCDFKAKDGCLETRNEHILKQHGRLIDVLYDKDGNWVYWRRLEEWEIDDPPSGVRLVN